VLFLVAKRRARLRRHEAHREGMALGVATVLVVVVLMVVVDFHRSWLGPFLDGNDRCWRVRAVVITKARPGMAWLMMYMVMIARDAVSVNDSVANQKKAIDEGR
jgi:hypothetical protein